MTTGPGQNIGPCSECRYWKEPHDTPTYLPPGEWRECERANSPDSPESKSGIHFNSQGWDRDGGAIMTRADFGCVQWNAKGEK